MLKTITIWLKFSLSMLIKDSNQIPELKEKGDGVLDLVIKLTIGS